MDVSKNSIGTVSTSEGFRRSGGSARKLNTSSASQYHSRRCYNVQCRVETFTASMGGLSLMGCPVCLQPGSLTEKGPDK